MNGSVTQVEFLVNGEPVGVDLDKPYGVTWTPSEAGVYQLRARATDNLGAVTTSALRTITVNVAVAKLYFIHVDHLNTPRAIYDEQQQLRWRWEQAEPFGVNVPDENPSGLGVFEFPLMESNYYRDKETGLLYSYFRDCYDPATGRFCQPDPAGSVMFRDMGFRSIGALGLTRPDLADLLESDKPKYNHPYTYAKNNPLSNTDPLGLLSQPDVCSLQGCTFEFGFISPLNPAMTLCYYRCFGITGLVPYRPKMAWCPPNIPHPGGL